MDTKYGFTRMTIDEFATWIRQQSISRTITHIQEHHTWSPSYHDFNGSNHFERQKAMKDYHVGTNHWADIGQHFTTFPDGMIVTGRPLANDPACIGGHNGGGICIENLGNFDPGGDDMTAAHRECIVKLTAHLCKRFSLSPEDPQVVYHHWFDSTGARTLTHPVKSCPGANFFGGNTAEAAKAHFFPLVKTALSAINPQPLPPNTLAMATRADLPVRKSPDPNAPIVRRLAYGEDVRVIGKTGNWLQLLPEGYVFAAYTAAFRKGRTTATSLNVRLSAPDGAIERTLPKGTIVRVFEEKNGWGRIAIESRWVSLNYIEFV